MKIKLIPFLILIVLVSCNNHPKNEEKTIEDTTNEVNELLDNWHKDAAETNFEEYFSVMSNDFTFLGTDGTENWNKSNFEEFCKPYFDKGKAWDFTCLERNIYFTNDNHIVWFDEDLDTGLGPCRGSGVLEYIDGKWLFASICFINAGR